MPFCGRFSGEVRGFCGFRLRGALRASGAVRETDVMVNCHWPDELLALSIKVQMGMMGGI